ncbi:MAG: molecular chaperone DnaJ [Bifidobacteriaceae bacterium]|nr:molecular chaperone DnaJ [Bifidobacteriaceae bacterium]
MNENNDYYGILGVNHDASPEEIKKAYRHLARQLHPDVAGDSPEAEEKIKDVNRAYDVLSNPDKRRQYDLGADPLGPGGTAGFEGGFAFPQGGFGDIFESLFHAATGGGRPAGPASRQSRGRDQLEACSIELKEAVFGSSRDLKLSTFTGCERCSGSCCEPGTSPVKCQACGGSGQVTRVVRSLLGNMRTTSPCPTCQGFGTVIEHPCSECAGTGRVRTTKTVSVKVPAGVGTGTRIRVPGGAEAGPGGGPNGDLYIEVRVKNDPDFQRDGDDLHCLLKVPMTAAALGARLQVETFDGTQDIQVKPGTQSGEVVTLDGLGVGRLHRKDRGDLKVHIQVLTPKPADDSERDLLRQLAKLRGEEVPEAQMASSGGVFGRIRDKLAGK